MSRIVNFILIYLLTLSVTCSVLASDFRKTAEDEILKRSNWGHVLLFDNDFDWDSISKITSSTVDLSRKSIKFQYLDLTGNTQTSAIKFAEGVDILFAKEEIQKGSAINAENTELRIIPRNKTGKHHIHYLEDAQDRVAARRIHSDRPIVVTDITKEYIVSKGDIVSIVYTGRNIVLESQGIALENGVFEERIKVKSTDSGKILYGKVIGKDKVVMQ